MATRRLVSNDHGDMKCIFHMCAQRLHDGGFPSIKPRFAARKTKEECKAAIL